MPILDDDAAIINPMTVSPRPTGVRYGVIIGIIGLILSALGYITGWSDMTGRNTTSLGYVLLLLTFAAMIYFLFVAIKEHKENELGGYLNLRRAVGVGVWAGLINGLISAFWMIIYTNFIDKDFYSNVREVAAEQYAAQGMGDDQIEAALDMVAGFGMFSPSFYVGSSIIGGIVVAAIISLIIGAILRRPYPEDAF